MHRKLYKLIFMTMCLMFSLFFLPSCASTHVASKESKPDVPLIPQADKTVLYTASQASLDASHTDQGYIMAAFAKDDVKSKLRITGPRGVTYTYDLTARFDAFPLTDGDGTYTVQIYEHMQNDQYALLLHEVLEVCIADKFLPFLYANQYVRFTEDSKALAVADKLAADTTTDLETISKIYNYVITNIRYDNHKADTVQAGYLPDIDETLKTEKGICFDYASLMSAMLRSQGIPCKLEIGYAQDAYHAWISTYTPETGWVDNMILFDGKTWELMDPTFASVNNNSPKIIEYISDAKHYSTKYTY